MSFLDDMEAKIVQALAAEHHAALWLVGLVTAGKKDWDTLNASSPLVQVAVQTGIAAAEKHGVVTSQELQDAQAVGDKALQLAKDIAGVTPTDPPTGA
jgi:hypothetical protein